MSREWRPPVGIGSNSVAPVGTWRDQGFTPGRRIKDKSSGKKAKKSPEQEPTAQEGLCATCPTRENLRKIKKKTEELGELWGEKTARKDAISMIKSLAELEECTTEPTPKDEETGDYFCNHPLSRNFKDIGRAMMTEIPEIPVKITEGQLYHKD